MVLIGGIFVAVLLISLGMLIAEESRTRNARIPRGTLKEYWSGEERRQSIRVSASVIVKYSVEKKPHVRLNGNMKDISSGGMQFLVNEKLHENTLLFLEFQLPEEKKAVYAEGKVVWNKGEFVERDDAGRRIFHTGVQFLNIKPDDRKMLVSYIEKAAEDPGTAP